MIYCFPRLVAVILSLALGIILCLYLFFSRKNRLDTGFFSYLFPLLIGFLYVALECLHICQECGFIIQDVVSIQTAEHLIFMAMGVPWIMYCYTHYRLNNVVKTGMIPLSFIIALTGFSYMLFFCGEFLPNASFLKEIASGFVSFVLLYSAVSLLLLLRSNNTLLNSSWSGLIGSGIGLIYFPFVVLVDTLNLKVSHYDPHVSFGLQIYPYYYSTLCFLIIGFLIRSFSERKKDIQNTVLQITRRERELIQLISEGKTNNEIAHIFNVSPFTVKTHVRNLYSKFNVHSRSELLHEVVKRKV